VEGQPRAVGCRVVKAGLGQEQLEVVYQAYDPGLDRSVALKCISQTDKKQCEQWRREAQIAADLSHPHIVPFHSVSQTDDSVYTLHRIALRWNATQEPRCPPSLERCVVLLLSQRNVLVYAQKYGIMHRGNRPSAPSHCATTWCSMRY
jgi:serine/threonine protein kinase